MGREGGGLEAIGVGGACGRPDVETATVRRPVGGLLRGGATEALGRAGKLASVIGGEDLAGGPWGLSGASRAGRGEGKRGVSGKVGDVVRNEKTGSVRNTDAVCTRKMGEHCYRPPQRV